jgi:hypothetical protein
MLPRVAGTPLRRDGGGRLGAACLRGRWPRPRPEPPRISPGTAGRDRPTAHQPADGGGGRRSGLVLNASSPGDPTTRPPVPGPMSGRRRTARCGAAERCRGRGSRGRPSVARREGAEDGGRPRPAVARTRGRRMAHAPRAGRRARGAGHAGRRALACPRGRRPLRAWRRARRPGCPRGPGRPGVESGVARNGDLRAPVAPSPRRGASQSGVYGTYCGNQIAASTAASSWSSRYARPVPASRACRATSVAIACETFRRSPAGG